MRGRCAVRPTGRRRGTSTCRHDRCVRHGSPTGRTPGGSCRRGGASKVRRPGRPRAATRGRPRRRRGGRAARRTPRRPDRAEARCPGHPELGVGAIAEDGVEIHNDDLISRLGITADELAAIAAAEHAEPDRRARRYRGDRRPVPVRGRTAIIVDDGLATAYTARAAIAVVRSRQPDTVVLAVPSRRQRPSRRCAPWWTTWSACARRRGSSRSASGTPTSDRCPTTWSLPSWPASTRGEPVKRHAARHPNPCGATYASLLARPVCPAH